MGDRKPPSPATTSAQALSGLGSITSFTYRIYVNGTLDNTTTNVAGISYVVTGANHYIGLGCYTGNLGLGYGGAVLNRSSSDFRAGIPCDVSRLV